MEKDPVCGMDVNPWEAAAQLEYMGVRFYFCSESCRGIFEWNPERFAGLEEGKKSR